MSISVKNDTKFPNASMALAQFFTNAAVDGRVQQAGRRSTRRAPASYDDPFFSETPSAIEDSARPLAKGIVSTYADIVPTIPNKADVNAIVLDAVESALFNDVDAQQALSGRRPEGQRVTQVATLLLRTMRPVPAPRGGPLVTTGSRR